MTSRGFNLPELPEFPPRLPPFLGQYQQQARRAYGPGVREKVIQLGQSAISKTEQAYKLVEEVHDLVKGMGISYEAGHSARDYSAGAIHQLGDLRNALQEQVRRNRAER